jgi:acetyl esterase/lipase
MQGSDPVETRRGAGVYQALHLALTASLVCATGCEPTTPAVPHTRADVGRMTTVDARSDSGIPARDVDMSSVKEPSPSLVPLPTADFELNGAPHAQFLLWPGEPPDADLGTEKQERVVRSKKKVGGKPWYAVEYVSMPTYMVFAPSREQEHAGATIVVFPGGGYKVLAIDLEGTEICDWVTSKGMTCVILKYRVPGTGCYWDKGNKTPPRFIALQDAQRVVRTLRAHSSTFQIDPDKIGVLGFSAGGNLVAMSSSHFDTVHYEPIDEIDALSARPDFAIALYPGHMTHGHKHNTKDGSNRINPDITFTAESPPTFLFHAKDDRVNPVRYSNVYKKELEKFNVPVVLHTPSRGGHAFGLRSTHKGAAAWPDLLAVWLHEQGFLSESTFKQPPEMAEPTSP